MTNPAPLSQSLEMGTDAAPSSRPTAEQDDAVFQELFESQFQYVWNALRRLGIPERDLEDVTHDVFVQVHRQRSLFDPERSVRPWLFGFAFRIASDYRRLARNRLEMLEPASDPPDPAPMAIDQLVRVEMLSIGYAALESLEMGRRAVFILYELDGCPMQEIAQALSIPVNTAYSRLRLAREQFHTKLNHLRHRRGAR